MSDETLRIYIGWDQREDEAYRICLGSLVRRTSTALHITPLKQNWLREMGYYTRSWRLDEHGNRVDWVDGRPFSTDFAFTRFLVPHLQHYMGWALFCDCDFLFREDVANLFALADNSCAVLVVKHDHRPTESVKMDGQPQQHYRRKNWSSLILWNCAHPSHRALSLGAVNNKPGSWLHGFEWLRDEEIGALPIEWNWLEGWSPDNIKPKAVHLTRGGPWLPTWQDVAYANEWKGERGVIDNTKLTENNRLMGKPLNIPTDRLPLRRVSNE